MAAGLATDGWKRSGYHYTSSARTLLNAMTHEGFSCNFPIPVDPDGELLGGAHRLACALVLGFENVPVEHRTQYAWAPAWDEAWFRANGLDESRLERIRGDMIYLCASSKGASDGRQEEGQGRQVLTQGRREFRDSRRLPNPRLGPIDNGERHHGRECPHDPVRWNQEEDQGQEEVSRHGV